jgi:peptidoglycan/LPS O-acetylase OafA/YrhL
MVRKILSNQTLLFFGFVSYPLYLVHDTIMIALLRTVASHAPWLPTIAWPMLPIATVTGIAWLIAKFGEPSLRNFLKVLGGLAFNAPLSLEVERKDSASAT